MSSIHRGHPLPPPPPPPGHQQKYQQQYQQTQRPEQRHRAKSSFSLRSEKSHKSSGSGPKIDLHETTKEKASRRLSNTTKADPRLAMEEAEPATVASTQATSLAPLRAIQHLDANGNPIADPDRSNPTRSRWERPLDTIRSFEAAIDGNYSRKSYMKTESADSAVGFNRRSSYFGGPRFGQDTYNGGRSNGYRLDSYYDNNTRPSNGYYPSRARYPRTATEPNFNNGTGVYPTNGNPQSYETVTTASGSGSSGEPLGYSTDPSSENSSVDRIQSNGIPEQINYNGANNYSGTSNYQASNYASNGYGGYPGKQSEMPLMSGGYQGQNGGPPPPPRKESAGMPPRVPIKLDQSAGGSEAGYQSPRPAATEKRKSWFGKRFSRN